MTTPGAESRSSAFTTLWTGEQCRRLISSGVAGGPLSLTFGGPHSSAPRFSRAGVRPGDLVYPVNVAAGRLRVLARFRVADLILAEEFVARFPDLLAGIEPGVPLHRLERWIASRPAVAAVCPGEADEVVTVTDSTAVTLDAVVPLQDVLNLRWQSGRQLERPIKHLDGDGRIKKTLSIQGVYRLTEASVAILDAVLAS